MSMGKTGIPFPPESLSKKLLAWYDQHGRDLPWRRTRNPYHIWLSEIMLQQTTVAAVIPYYERFLERFPDVKSLAAASEEDVLRLWSGLGYYSRARNLHKAARYVVEICQGIFPETVDGLQLLPGVGRSTAGAIVSIAFDRPAPILDGNVRRVLARLMALPDPPRERTAEKRLWDWAEALTPQVRPHDYAQAIMDLGATVCVPRQPDCERCPLSELCRARLQNLQDVIPVPAKRVKIPSRRQVVLVVMCRDRLLVRRRPVSGLLGGMWEFPCRDVEGGSDPDDVLPGLISRYAQGTTASFAGTVRHTYSHFRLAADVYVVNGRSNDMFTDDDCFWHDAETLPDSPLHGAHQKVMALALKDART